MLFIALWSSTTCKEADLFSHISVRQTTVLEEQGIFMHMSLFKLRIIYRHYFTKVGDNEKIRPLNAELNPICHLLALLAHHILHVSRIWANDLYSFTNIVPVNESRMR
jgi:hypothetical protein